LQLSRKEYFFILLLCPHFYGLRIAVGLAWLAIIAEIVMSGIVGIGFYLGAYQNNNVSEVIALIYIGVVGVTR